MLKKRPSQKSVRVIKGNIIDRVVSYFHPVAGARRLRARTVMALAGGYAGASKLSRAMKMWTTFSNDADADILPDLPTLRERSRDLVRNNPLAAGAIKTKVTNVVGTGLRLQSRIDRGALNLSDDAASAWETKTEREWRLFWGSQTCDITRKLNGRAMTKLVYRQAKENGDVLIVLPRKKNPHFPYDLRLQIIEADRLCNENYAPDTNTLAGGVETDTDGAPVRYHILKQHPGAAVTKKNKTAKWDKVDAFGKNLGLRNVIHLFIQDRPGQSRGVPDLAPVIEPLRQLGKYSDAELMAAVISGMFTIFIESDTGETDFDPSSMTDETGAKSTDNELKMAAGSIIGLNKGESIHDSNPGRPNTSFEPFVQAILRQVGVALELPFEILIKHFTSSYSAARAAMLEAWKYFIAERQWLADNFCQVVYEIWMFEAVINGRIAAPGFLNDPIIRQAYLGSEWIGPTKGQIDELKEIKAAQLRVDGGISTLSEVTAEMTGGDWETKHKQRVKEFEARKVFDQKED